MKLTAKTWIAVAACTIAVAAICVALVLTTRTKGGAEPNSAPPVASGEEERLESGEAQGGGKRPVEVQDQTRRRSAKRSRGKEGKKVRKDVTAKPPGPSAPSAQEEDDDDDGLTPEERALSKRIEDLDEEKPEDLEKAVACAKEALNCPNAEIRQDMVDALGRFGEKGLPQLTPFLADPDEDVRDSAMNEWSMALSEIEDEPEKLGIVELAMGILTDEEALEDIADEYIGADEKVAVESLLRVIEGEGCEQGIARAKETYEFVTGEEFTDRAAAEKWIAEECMPDEDSQQEQMK